MALKINTTITTDEGFEVSNAFAYLNIYILNPESNWVNISYYKSQSDWENGKAPLNVNALPSNVQTELTSDEFWSNVLAVLIHTKCKNKIEEILGPNTTEIIQ